MQIGLSSVIQSLSRSGARVLGWCLRGRCGALSEVGGLPVGQGHEVAVDGARGVEVVGSFFEFLAQVEQLLSELADADTECLDFVGHGGGRRRPGPAARPGRRARPVSLASRSAALVSPTSAMARSIRTARRDRINVADVGPRPSYPWAPTCLANESAALCD